MFEEYQICPYTGLRSFTEEESLYFKGRDEHIEQATLQLQRNKFLMVTGASGDGKSSLVFAGIIPYARAGFLKAKYSQWCVADFRPERSPFVNLCKAIADQLGIADPHTVEAELRHGFSALVELYRNSKRFLDRESASGQSTDAATRREGANLLILVDQFEEFFTNPENYHGGVPSQSSNLVLNLLLETARLALEEDLPIYVVFTMRSDYIGQCASFRELPEYIGFSQFFVPRLNRSQLQLVIEEPASLSGNRIARRLTERLIYDISEGVDQLPILQHALAQIWLAAANGKEEMDLIHYAMVGGMPAAELPDKETGRFMTWFGSLPAEIKACYQQPNLGNVLNAHLNKLYEQAAEYFRKYSSTVISDADTKLAVKTIFTCLTKVDQSRAVRNRMTLREITDILGLPSMGAAEVAIIVSLFREPGNTFIRPFMTEGDDRVALNPDQVLDITHESLIRNWEYLDTWVKEEFTNYNIFLDFKQQLDRWIASGKSGAFLLSIGPLTYFESWYNRVNPNASWIARYLSDDVNPAEKISNAAAVLDSSREFIRLSARKHLVTRTVVRYGAKRIAAVMAVLALVVFGSFATIGFFKRQNSYVLNQITKDVGRLASSGKIKIRTRAWAICEEMKTGSMTIRSSLRQTSDPIERINIVNGVTTSLVYYGRREPQREIREGLTVVDSLLNEFPPSTNYGSNTSRILKEVNDLSKMLEMAYYYNPSSVIDSFRRVHAKRSAEWTRTILRARPAGFHDIAYLNVALEFGILHRVFSSDDVQEFIQILSPFEGTGNDWVENRYANEKMYLIGYSEYGLRFNGLYQELGYLYGAAGDAQGALQAIDSLLKYSQNYFQRKYANLSDNAAHIATAFYKYGHETALDEFVKGYCMRTKTERDDFYSRLLARCKIYEFASTVQDFNPQAERNLNLSLEFSEPDQLVFFFRKYREVLAAIQNRDERNFLAALSYKDEAMIHLRRLDVQQNDSLVHLYEPLFDRAVELYQSVREEYREQMISVVKNVYSDLISVPRRFLFVYPDIRTSIHPNEPQLYHFFYTTDAFLKYIFKKGLFHELYNDQYSQRALQFYIQDYTLNQSARAYTLVNDIDYRILLELEKNLDSIGIEQTIDPGLLHMHAAVGAAENKEAGKIRHFTQKMTTAKIQVLFSDLVVQESAFPVLAKVIAYLSLNGDQDEAYRLVRMFNNPINRSGLYAYAAWVLVRTSGYSKHVDQLIDSSRADMKRLIARDGRLPNRTLLAGALTLLDEGNLDEANAVIKNLSDKRTAIKLMCRALAYNGEVFKAVQIIPKGTSDGDHGLLLVDILTGYSERDKEIQGAWNEYTRNLEQDIIGSYPIFLFVDDKI